MPMGTINRLMFDRGFGFIKPAAGGEDVWFHGNSLVEPLKFDQLRVGQEVQFEVQKSPRGFQARSVRAVGGAEPQADRTPARAKYRFLNPYNFVRFLAPPGDQKQQQPETAMGAKLRAAGMSVKMTNSQAADLNLLGHCMPPPHDRYLGLTGRIKCTLEAVTPLFISDSHEVRTHQNDHRSYEFFKLDGKAALAASSLRGMVRNLLEAASNSCVSQLADSKLSHRLDPKVALSLVPARLEQNSGGGWQLRLLTGTSSLRIGEPPGDLQYAAWLMRYRPIRESFSTKGNTPYSRRSIVNLNGFHHGSRCWALLERLQHPRGNFHFWNVRQISHERPEGELAVSGTWAEGYLHINNQNIENKHDERFFFHKDGVDNAPIIPLASGEHRRIPEGYSALITDYQERHAKAVEKRKRPHEPNNDEPAYSRFILQKDAELRNGELVYAMVSGTPARPVAEYLVPVAMPRVFYNRSVADLLPAGAPRACTNPDKLCLACRLFGWVHGEPPKDLERSAYAGRVNFSHGTLQHDAGRLPPTSLAILSSPKPTTTRFYLKPENGAVPQQWSLPEGYDGRAVLRGRKLYRNHGKAVEEEYSRAGGVCNDQNRTVRDAMKPGARFEFDIRFVNLAPVELGALLWTLQMDGKSCHRLGFGKPLGFGSVSLSVSAVELLDPTVRYHSLSDPGWRACEDWHSKFVERFKNSLARRYGAAGFDQLPNIQDIRSLLSEPPEGLPIHYPRTGPKPDPKGRNFEWFLGNNRKRQYALPHPAEERGLPLIKRDGTEI